MLKKNYKNDSDSSDSDSNSNNSSETRSHSSVSTNNSYSDSSYSDSSEDGIFELEELYNGKDCRVKSKDKYVYSGSCVMKINEVEQYINMENGGFGVERENLEIEVPFKCEIYNMYVDIERARYEEDIIFVLMKNGNKTNLMINTEERQDLINYNITDCVLCNVGDKIVISVMGKQSKARKIKWAITYCKI